MRAHADSGHTFSRGTLQARGVAGGMQIQGGVCVRVFVYVNHRIANSGGSVSTPSSSESARGKALSPLAPPYPSLHTHFTGGLSRVPRQEPD